jgi:hypothetical protein
MNKRTLISRTVAIVGLCLCLSPRVLAQGVGAIGGTVMDASGAVLPGVAVTLSNPGTIGGNQETVTDERGAYQFVRLVPGRYTVKALLAGFRPAADENIIVNAAATARADLTLVLGQLAEGVVVVGEAPLLDTTSALHQTVMSREILDTLPGMNDVWGAAKLVPGVQMNKYDVGGTEGFQQATISVHGSRQASETSYLIDGMSTNSVSGDGGTVTMYFDPFMFEQINYQAGGVTAETSRGGIVYNMVTRTGTNEFRGAFMANGSTKPLQSSLSPELQGKLFALIPARVLVINPNAEPNAQIIKMWDTGMVFGGPIKRDKLWFMATGKGVRLDQYRIGSYNPDGTQFVDDNALKTFSIKPSWQISKRSQLHFTNIFTQKQRFHYSGNVTTDFNESNATVVQNLSTHLNQVTWTTTLSGKLLLDVSGSNLNTFFGSPPQPAVKIGDIPGYDSLTQTHMTAAETYNNTRYLRDVFYASLNYVSGKHDLKGGYQLEYGRHGVDTWSMSNYPSGLRAVFRNGAPNSVNTYNTPNSNVDYIKDSVVYVQDKWTPVRRITVNVGLRLEKEVGWQPAVCQVETIFIAGQCFAAIKGVPDFFDPAPRSAVIFDLFGNGRTAVKIGASRYNIGTGSGITTRINPNRTTNDTRSWNDSNNDLIPQLSELGQSTGFNLGTTSRYNPDLKRPYAAEYSAEIEQQLFKNTVVSAGYYRRGIRRIIGSRNLLVPTSSYMPIQVTEVASGRQVTVYNQDPATRGKFDVLWDNYPELNSQYNGVEMSFTKRLANRWMFMTNVSVGKNVGDISETGDLNNPNFTFRRGIIGDDVPFAVKASGIYEFAYGLMVSGNLQHYVGLPETTTVSVSSSTVALTQVTQSLVVEPRATHRLPDVNLIDLNVRRVFRFSKGRSFEPVVELFNILNSSATQARTTVLGPSYGNIANILRGRMAKVAINVKF